MSARVPWSYVQARLQARHGERLQEADWHALEAARSLDQYIERSRASSLRRFTARFSSRMTSHALERALRGAWRDYVAELAAWSLPVWRPAILWTASLPDLPVIDALLRGERPPWAEADPVFAEFAEGKPREAKRFALAPLLPGEKRAATLPQRWHAQWQALWPKGRARERRALAKLTELVRRHVERLGGAGAQEASAPYRQELAQAVTRMFRRQSGTPVAVFCHLVLVALDLERLRGGLARRRLFAVEQTREAA